MQDQPPLWQDARWIVTTLIALWGAGLASWERLAKRRELTPKIEVVVYESVGFGGPGPEQRFIAIHVKNTGKTEAVFHDNCRSIAYEGSQTRLALYTPPINAKLPLVLRSGDAFTTHVPLQEILPFLKKQMAGGPVRIKACVQDAIQRESCSAYLTVSLSSSAS